MTDSDNDPWLSRFRESYRATPIDPATAPRVRAALRGGRSRWTAIPILLATSALTAVLAWVVGVRHPSTIAAPADSLVPVTFEVSVHAAHVAVVGDFNGWDPDATPMTRTTPGGPWQAHVRVGPGRSEYAFVLDGRTWIPDPAAPLSPSNAFGGRNSVLTLRPTGAL